MNRETILPLALNVRERVRAFVGSECGPPEQVGLAPPAGAAGKGGRVQVTEAARSMVEAVAACLEGGDIRDWGAGSRCPVTRTGGLWCQFRTRCWPNKRLPVTLESQ